MLFQPNSDLSTLPSIVAKHLQPQESVPPLSAEIREDLTRFENEEFPRLWRSGSPRMESILRHKLHSIDHRFFPFPRLTLGLLHEYEDTPLLLPPVKFTPLRGNKGLQWRTTPDQSSPSGLLGLHLLQVLNRHAASAMPNSAREIERRLIGPLDEHVCQKLLWATYVYGFSCVLLFQEEQDSYGALSQRGLAVGVFNSGDNTWNKTEDGLYLLDHFVVRPPVPLSEC